MEKLPSPAEDLILMNFRLPNIHYCSRLSIKLPLGSSVFTKFGKEHSFISFT